MWRSTFPSDFYLGQQVIRAVQMETAPSHADAAIGSVLRRGSQTRQQKANAVVVEDNGNWQENEQYSCDGAEFDETARVIAAWLSLKIAKMKVEKCT